MKKILCIMFVCVLLNACSSSVKHLEMGKLPPAKYLYIQKVEQNASKEELTKVVTDEGNIRETLKLLQGIEVKEMNGDKLMDSMKNKDTYMFCYYESKEAAEDMNQKNILFAFNIVGDGEVMIIHQGKISSLNTPLVSTEVHGKLLKKLKGILGIDF